MVVHYANMYSYRCVCGESVGWYNFAYLTSWCAKFEAVHDLSVHDLFEGQK